MSDLRPRSQSVFARSKFRPALEALEERYCLDSAPTVAFTVTPVANGCVLISGQVTSDTSAANLTVSINGVVNSGTETDTDGMFSVIAHATSMGLIDVTACDSSNQPGETQSYFYVPPPTITSFQITYLGGGYFGFTGHVSDSWAPGMTVTFTGLAALEGHTATVNSNGDFSMSLSLAPGQAGAVTCRVWDFWGNQSQATQGINTTV